MKLSLPQAKPFIYSSQVRWLHCFSEFATDEGGQGDGTERNGMWVISTSWGNLLKIGMFSSKKLWIHYMYGCSHLPETDDFLIFKYNCTWPSGPPPPLPYKLSTFPQEPNPPLQCFLYWLLPPRRVRPAPGGCVRQAGHWCDFRDSQMAPRCWLCTSAGLHKAEVWVGKWMKQVLCTEFWKGISQTQHFKKTVIYLAIRMERTP